ncbi:MAG TPA: magnesium transporter CorA family protein [Actinomycetes bacterium]|jgi:Mg2+ and Co2+ transporter CorA|nr:magnesium transporter CorA family protein [Actinomycetes bacterium]
MDVRLIADGGVEQHPVEELETLIALQEGLVWVDIPTCDQEAVRVLSEVFGFHPLAVRDCVERNHIPKVHAYSDHVFVVLHAPERGKGGHVHYLELDQFVGPGFVVTVHGPLDSALDPDVALRDTRAVLKRIEAGRMCPASSFELSYAIVSAMARHQEGFVATLARETGLLEQQVMGGDIGNPEEFLEELFRARHELLVVRTMAAQSREIYGRMATLARFVPGQSQPQVADIVDQFERVGALADGQKEFLQGVIEFYRTRTETKMTIAAERLAVIAAVTLPITALSSIYGMNVIANARTDFVHLAVVLVVMAAMSAALLRWARRQGWW